MAHDRLAGPDANAPDAVRPAAVDPRLDEAEALLAAVPPEAAAASDPQQVEQLEQVHALLAATLASVPRA